MIISSSACLPKASFHCGNAISVILTDLICKYNEFALKKANCHCVLTPWNLHGLPYEKMYVERFSKTGTYEEIRDFALSFKSIAESETNYFLDSSLDRQNVSDIDEGFVDFTKECFIKLCQKDYIKHIGDDWFIDTGRMLSDFSINEKFSDITVIPSYHKSSIINQHKVFNGFYPISKNRIFSVSADYKNSTVFLNPIFQSFIYPLYLKKLFNDNAVSYLVSGSGFSMLKWAYYKELMGLSLEKVLPVECFVFHGTILGADNKAMSKHSFNTVKPSDIYHVLAEKEFVRYTLIRSLSNNNIQIQFAKAYNEYTKISGKIKQIKNAALKPEVGKFSYLLDESLKCMSEFKFNSALENLYVFCKKTAFSEEGSEELLYKANLICKILL